MNFGVAMGWGPQFSTVSAHSLDHNESCVQYRMRANIIILERKRLLINISMASEQCSRYFLHQCHVILSKTPGYIVDYALNFESCATNIPMDVAISTISYFLSFILGTEKNDYCSCRSILRDKLHYSKQVYMSEPHSSSCSIRSQSKPFPLPLFFA